MSSDYFCKNKFMKYSLFFFLICFSSTFCTPTKKVIVKMPSEPKSHWFTKKSLDRYKKEFVNKDWTKRDTTYNRFLDSVQKAIKDGH